MHQALAAVVAGWLFALVGASLLATQCTSSNKRKKKAKEDVWIESEPNSEGETLQTVQKIPSPFDASE